VTTYQAINIFCSAMVFTLTLSYVSKHPQRKRLQRWGVAATIAFALGAGLILVVTT
jgi:hypothetical protein